MRNILNTIVIILLGVVAASCSDTERFRISGTIAGEPSMNLRIKYYNDGAYRMGVTSADKGKFEFFGHSKQPVMVEITDYAHRTLARIVARNGETYDLAIDPADPYALTADGSDINKRWSGFLRDNADALRTDPSPVVADYIADHPDDLLSTILLVTLYRSGSDAEAADSLLSGIAAAARPSSLVDGYNTLLGRLVAMPDSTDRLTVQYIDRRDTLHTVDPADASVTLISISTKTAPRADSIVPMMRRLHRRRTDGIAVADILVDYDTFEWKRATRPDTAVWPQGWAPAGIAGPALSRLRLASHPCIVVLDSAGTELYRGTSSATAEAIALSHAKKK